MNTTSNRRSFLTTLSVIAAAPVVCRVNRSTAAWAEDLKPGSLPALEESNPVATALGYRHDATKVDTAKFPKRAGAEGEKQFCHNCSLLPERGFSVAGQQGEFGKCSLFPQGLVHVNGWCNSWTAKPPV
jgi:High potential iron-sulfur protein